MNSFEAVHATIRGELSTLSLPPYLNITVDLFRKSHLYFRTYKLYNTFNKSIKDSSNGNAAVYGAALHLASDHTSLHYPLEIALITKCAKDIIGQYRRVSESYRKLCETIKWQYPLYQHVGWRRGDTSGQTMSPPSFYLRCQLRSLNFVAQIFKIKNCSVDLIWKIFKLSMSINDAYLLSNGDQGTRYEGFTELIGKWNKYRKRLENDKKFFFEELKKGSKLTDKILNYLEAEESSSGIIKKVRNQVAETLEQTDELMDDLYETGEKSLGTFHKKGKITPLKIDLSAGKTTPPALPKGRFPPWGGKPVKILTKRKNPASPSILSPDGLLACSFNDLYAWALGVKSNLLNDNQECQEKSSNPFI